MNSPTGTRTRDQAGTVVPAQRSSTGHSSPGQTTVQLCAADKAVLELADRHLLGDEFTEQRTELGFTNDTAYHRKLNWLLDSEHSAAAEPDLVARLRRWRSEHSATRR